MEFRDQVLDLLAEVAENDIVKENPTLKSLKKELLIHSKQLVYFWKFKNKLDIEVSIMDFDRDEWATPNKIVEALEELR